MSDSIQIFSSCVQKFLERNTVLSGNDNHLYIFQGFPVSFLKALDIPHLAGEWDGSYPDALKLDGSEILPFLITSKGQAWCFYEEFQALSMLLKNFNVYKGTMTVIKNDLFSDYYPLPESMSPEKISELFRNDSGKKAVNDSDLKLLDYYSDCRTDGNILFVSFIDRHTEHNINETGFFWDMAGILPADGIDSASDDEGTISSLPLSEIKVKLMNGELKNSCFIIQDDGDDSIDAEITKMNTLGRFFGTKFKASHCTKKNDSGEQYLHMLKKYWGSEASFRELMFYESPAENNRTMTLSQGRIISDVIEQSMKAASGENYSDIIVTAPTGSGKSIFFQIPAIYLHEEEEKPLLTIIICPLVSLMYD